MPSGASDVYRAVPPYSSYPWRCSRWTTGGFLSSLCWLLFLLKVLSPPALLLLSLFPLAHFLRNRDPDDGEHGNYVCMGA